MNDEQLIQYLREQLGAYFHSFEGTRNLGRGTAFPASADVPGGLQADDRFTRTDIDLECYYDGSQWLTFNEWGLTLSQFVSLGTANTNTSLTNPRYDYGPYITRATIYTRVSTTNNGTNYWQVDVQGINPGITASTSVYVFNTSADAAGGVLRRDVGPGSVGFTAAPTNRDWFRCALTKTGAPGAIELAAHLSYKLIVP